MFKKNLGNTVASEMEAVLNSDEYAKYFSKEAKAKCGCPESCDCHEKLGKHAAEDCGCKEKEEKKKEAELEVEAPSMKESFDNLVNKFVSLSSELDELGFDKASARVLESFDVLLKEAAGEPVEQEIEEAINAIQQLGDDAVEINVDIDEKDPVVDERLMGGEEEDLDLDLATTIKALDELGLGGEMSEELSEDEKDQVKGLGLGLASAELAAIEKATQEVSDWLSKNASEEDLSNGPSVDFELDAELSALLAEDQLDEQLVSTAEEDEDEEEDKEDEASADDGDDEEFEDED